MFEKIYISFNHLRAYKSCNFELCRYETQIKICETYGDIEKSAILGNQMRVSH